MDVVRQAHSGRSGASSLWVQWGKLTVGAVGQAHCGCSGKLTVDDAILGQVGLGCVRIVAEQASKELSSTILPQFLPLGFYLVSRLASVIHYHL